MQKKTSFRLIKNLDWQNPVSTQKALKRVSYILDQGSIEEQIKLKKYQDELIDFHWRYYQELALQRERIKDKIFNALIGVAIDKYEAKSFQRCVKYKYGLHPLSTLGSLVPPGGRFNVGDVNSSIKKVPAIYLAEDLGTALQEALLDETEIEDELSNRELALSKSASICSVTVEIKLESVLNLSHSKVLKRFVDLIKDFKISSELRNRARLLGIEIPQVVKTHQSLHSLLLLPKWRHMPALYDVPWNSQIFGNICAEAGLQGILFPSTRNSKKCMAIYPENLKDSDSYIQILDDYPIELKVPRLDAKNFHKSNLSYNQL